MPSMNVAEGPCEILAQTWAEEVRRQLARVQAIREDFDSCMSRVELDDRAAPPPEQLDAIARRLWAIQHQLVWSAHQLERWSRRLALERGNLTGLRPSPTRHAVVGLGGWGLRSAGLRP